MRLLKVTEWWLSPLSISEMLYKVTHRKLPAPQQPGWVTESLSGYRLAPFSFEAGQLAGEWPWEHGDPVDRCLGGDCKHAGVDVDPHRHALEESHRFSAEVLCE